MTRYCCRLPKARDKNHQQTKGRSLSGGAGLPSHHAGRDDTNQSTCPSDPHVYIEDDESDTGGNRRSHSRRHRGGQDSNQSYQTGDSDYQAVEWMRQRSSESHRSSFEISEQVQQQWTRQGSGGRQQPAASVLKSAKTFREESIEVDDLSLFGVRILDQSHSNSNNTASSTTASSSFDSPTFPMDDHPPTQKPTQSSTSSSSSPRMNSATRNESVLPQQQERRNQRDHSQEGRRVRKSSSPAPVSSSRFSSTRRGDAGALASKTFSTSSPQIRHLDLHKSKSDAEEELDAIIESVSSWHRPHPHDHSNNNNDSPNNQDRGGSRRRRLLLHEQGASTKATSSPNQKDQRHTTTGVKNVVAATTTTATTTDDDDEALLVAGATTLEYLADFDNENASSWSPRRGASPSPTKTTSATVNVNNHSHRRYVMQAVPHRPSSPRSSPRSSPKASPRSSPKPSDHDRRRRRGSPSASPNRRQLQELRSLNPILPADDSLSYVPSDVDSSTKQRYLRACRLLKSALIERDTSLLPQERAFLTRLLEEPGPVDLDEQASAIETASFTLLSDPLFQVDSVHSSSFAEFESVVGRGGNKNGDGGGGNGNHTKDKKQNRSSRNHDKKSLLDSPVRDNRETKSHQAGNPNGKTSPSAPPLVVVDVRHDDQQGKERATASSVAVARFDGKDYPFYILGVTPDFKVGALTPTLMESLRGFFPPGVSEENLFLKFSLQRDGPSLPTLLSRVRTSKHTILAVETTDGYVFGAYCSAPWRTQSGWFGNEDSFLWRLKRPRFHERSKTRNFEHDSEIEVYPVFRNTRIQYCTSKTLAVGGGEWSKDADGACPYPDEPVGIGFMIDGDLMGGETNSCSTFCNPRLGQRIVSKGGNEFDIRCLEVWTVTPAISIEEAENLEMRRHFVEYKTSNGLSSHKLTAL